MRSDDLRPCGCRKGGRHRRACEGPREAFRQHRDRYPTVSVYVGPDLFEKLKAEAEREGITPGKVLLRAWIAQSSASSAARVA